MFQKFTRRAAALALPVLVAGCGSPEEATIADQDQPPITQRVAPLRGKDARAAVRGHYIVTLKPGKARHEALRAVAAAPTFVYGQALNGFAGYLSDSQVASLRAHPDVLDVEEDQVIQAEATQSGVTWGLDRIDQRALPLSNSYSYGRTGGSVNAYIIDTGIMPNHQEFGGRAQVAYDALGGNGVDCNGHGTHVAGTIGAATYGVAKGVQLRGVRVLDCDGGGSVSQVIAGIDWVRANHVKPAVANLSIGGNYSAALNDAVRQLSAAGVFVAVAAGNTNIDACSTSPASVTEVYTVAASSASDGKANFSNYGTCVDGYAPGVDITSTWLGGGIRASSGTSMAAPHVTALAAHYKQVMDAPQGTINAWINSNATTNLITGNPANTPNRLIYTRASIAPLAPSPLCGVLIGGQGLRKGQSLTACGGVYSLVLQNDNNLVLYKNGNVPLWATGTNALPVEAVTLQYDGNLVVTDAQGNALWQSGTSGNPVSALAVQSDGNAVIYNNGRALWATNTAGR